MRRSLLWAAALALLAGCELPMAAQMNNPNDKNSTSYGGGSSSSKDITSFAFVGAGGGSNPLPTVTGTITNSTASTIAITVPFGTDVTNLVATFAASGTSVKVGNVVQTSGSTPNDFTSPVVYNVVGVDGTLKYYTVSTKFPVVVSYAATSNPSIVANALNTSTGVLSPVNGSPYPTPVSMLNLASDPLGRILLGSQATGILYAYQITPGTGALTALTVSPANYSNPIAGSPVFDPRGKFAYVLVNAAVGLTVYIYPVSPTSGSFGASFTTSYLGNFTPGQLQIAPNGKYALLSDTIASGNIHYYSVDQTSGALTSMGTSTQTWPTAGTRVTAMDKTSQYVVGASVTTTLQNGVLGSFVVSPPASSINNLNVPFPPINFTPGLVSWDPTGTNVVVGSNSTGSLYGFNLSAGALAIGGSSGTMAALTSAPNSMAFNGSGQYLFVGDTSGNILSFNVSSSGVTNGSSFIGGMASRWLTLDPSGQYLLGAGQGGTGFVSSYQVVSATTLSPKGTQNFSSGGTTNALAVVSVGN